MDTGRLGSGEQQRTERLTAPCVSGTFVVVIPAYNEAASIQKVVTSACTFGWGVVVVDDGSTDGTAEQLTHLPVMLLRNEQNAGKAASLWRGFQTVIERGGTAVITLDGDGQHDPRDIPRLTVASCSNPGSIVIGARQYGWYRYLTARGIANRLADFCISWASGAWIQDSQSGFRVYPRELLRQIDIAHDRPHGFVFESEVLIVAARLGYGTVAVPINISPRLPGQQSHFHPVLDTLRIAKMIFKSLCASRFSVKNLLKTLAGRPYS